MKAAVLRRYGQPVELSEIERPVPGPTDIVVKVHAASVNPLDWKVQEGKLKLLLPYRLPMVLGYDCSGVVDSVGVHASRFHPGDEVYALMDPYRVGTFAEYAVVDESLAARKPKNLSHQEAASLPMAGLTAWQTLVEVAQTQAGQKVLIHGGAGGVGTLALQLARRHLKSHPVTTASAKDKDRLKALGAEQVIDYRTQDFTQEVRDVDVVLDTQGARTLEKSFGITRPGGAVVSIGALPYQAALKRFQLPFGAGFLLDFLNGPIFKLAKRAQVRYTWVFVRPDGEQLARLADLAEAGDLKPVIDQVYPLADIEAALRHVAAGHAKGKVVIDTLT